MKKLIFTFLALFSTFIVFAQGPGIIYRPIYIEHFEKNPEDGTLRLLGTRSDLYNTQFAPLDSTNISYYSTNGLKHIVNNLNYDNVSTSWYINSTSIFSYNTMGMESVFVQLTGGTISTQPDSSFKSVKTYNTQNLLEKTIYFSYNSTTNVFEPTSKQEIYYNGNGDETLSIQFTYNTTTMSYDSTSKIVNVYSGNDNIQTTNYFNPGSGLVPSQRTNRQFDGNGNALVKEVFSYNTTTTSFDPLSLDSNTYDGNGNQLSQKFFYYSGTSYSPTGWFFQTYNTGNMVVNDLYLFYNTTTSLYDTVYRDTYQYTAGVQTYYLYENYFDSIPAFVPASRYNGTLDANNNPDIDFYEAYNATTMVWDTTTYNTFDYNTSNYKTFQQYNNIGSSGNIEPSSRSFFYYESDPFFSVKPQILSKLKVFPNPVQTHLNVSIQSAVSGFSMLRIIDMQGRIVYLKQLNMVKGQNTITFNVADLKAGIYSLTVSGGTGQFSTKIIKR